MSDKESTVDQKVDLVPDRPPPDPTATHEEMNQSPVVDNGDGSIRTGGGTLKRCLYREGQRSLKNKSVRIHEESTEIPINTNAEIIYQFADELSHQTAPMSPKNRQKHLNMKRYYCTQSHNLKLTDRDRFFRYGNAGEHQIEAVRYIPKKKPDLTTVWKIGLVLNLVVLLLKLAAFYFSFSSAVLATVIQGLLDLVSWDRCDKAPIPVTDSHFNHTRHPPPTTTVVVSIVLGFAYGALLAVSLTSIIWTSLFLRSSEEAELIILAAGAMKLLLLIVSVRFKAPKRAIIKSRQDLISIGLCLAGLILYKELPSFPIIDSITAWLICVTVIFYWIKQLRQVDSRNLAILSQEMTRILAMTISHDQRLRAVERLQTDLHGEAVNIHLFIDFQLGVEHADAERSSRQLRIKLEQLPFVHHAYVDVVQLEKAAYA